MATPTGGRSPATTSPHWYGRTPESRIADPADPASVFNWLLCASYDDKGNAMLYEYVAEDSAGSTPAWPTSGIGPGYPRAPSAT